VVRTLLNEGVEAGMHTVPWDATDDTGHRVASGIYHYRLKAGSFEETKKMVLLK
jgi:flagellar hook assembly protein FlgD